LSSGLGVGLDDSLARRLRFAISTPILKIDLRDGGNITLPIT
jgi:hypothetical protein